MALPLSGQISMDDIRVELGVPTQSPFGLNEARDGTYVALNQNSPTLPPSSGTVSLSDWYSYDQDAGPSYNYYTTTRFPCPNCSGGGDSGVIARTTSSLTTNHYYNNGDGDVYRIDGSDSGPSYTVDLDGAASAGTDCTATCAI